MKDWREELIAISENRLAVSYTDELILQTAPTRTLIGTGVQLEHGIIAANDTDGWTKRLMRIGVADHGWAQVDKGVGGTAHTGVIKGEGMDKAQWLMEVQDAMYFPVKEWDLLPPCLHLTQYDIGHQVVFTHAEVMGRTGTVMMVQERAQQQFGQEPQQQVIRVRMKDGNPIEVLQSAVAAVVTDGDFEGAVSIGLKYPAGSRVWVKSHVRAGQPYVWRPAISMGWKLGKLAVSFLDTAEHGVMQRGLLAAGDQPAPETVEIARRKDGSNPVPRGKRAKKWNVPRANS